MPPSYKEGSDFIIRLYLKKENGDYGDAVMRVEADVTNLTTEIDESYTTVITSTFSPSSFLSALMPLDFTFSGTDVTIGAMIRIIYGRIANDVSDTYGGSIRIHQVVLLYEKDTNGSRTATTK